MSLEQYNSQEDNDLELGDLTLDENNARAKVEKVIEGFFGKAGEKAMPYTREVFGEIKTKLAELGEQEYHGYDITVNTLADMAMNLELPEEKKLLVNELLQILKDESQDLKSLSKEDFMAFIESFGM